MAEGGDIDDFEMKEMRPEEREEEEEKESEDDRDEDEDEDEDDVVTIKRPSGDIPKVGKDVGVIRRTITMEKKGFFKNNLNTEIRVGDGPDSLNLLSRTKILYDIKNRPRGLSFDGVEVLVGTEERVSGIAKGREKK